MLKQTQADRKRAIIRFDTARQNKAFWDGAEQTVLLFRQQLEISFAGFPKESVFSRLLLTPEGGGPDINFPSDLSSPIFEISLTTKHRKESLATTRVSIRSQQPLQDMEEGQLYFLTVEGIVGGTGIEWKIDPQLINRAGMPTGSERYPKAPEDRP